MIVLILSKIATTIQTKFIWGCALLRGKEQGAGGREQRGRGAEGQGAGRKVQNLILNGMKAPLLFF
jgi:hypothetical protein